MSEQPVSTDHDALPFELFRVGADVDTRVAIARRIAGDSAVQRVTLTSVSPDASTTEGLADSARYYVPDSRLLTAINMAIRVKAPLLVTGEPGTGKTQAAYYIAWYLGLEKVYRFQARSTSTAVDMKYDFDAVAYLRSAQARESKPRWDPEFLKPGPLWQAYEETTPCVLLIDEIDKAPRDFPNDLLQELGERRFEYPFRPDTTAVQPKAKESPIVVATSNAERRLPDVFLRRCIAHHIEITPTFLKSVVNSRRNDRFPTLADEVLNAALKQFETIRSRELRHKPSTAELLTWLSLLSAMNVSVDQLAKKPSELPAISALIKDPDDEKSLR